MIKLVLAFFGLLRYPLTLAGVDYAQFRVILETKLTLDTLRRNPTTSGFRPSKKKRNFLALTLVIYSFFGLFVSMLVAFAASPLVGFTIVFAFVMVMTAVSLIGDFSSVLLDTTDHELLGPRPISRRTLLAARIAHVFSYMALLSLSLSACTFFTGTVRYGAWLPPVLLLTLLLAMLWVIAVVVVLYLLLMRLLDEQKVRDAIVYVQVAMTVIFVAGYQVLPRLVDTTKLRELDISDRAWIYFSPPSWLAGLIDLCAGNRAAPQLVLSALGLVVPVLSVIAVQRLAPSFRPSEGSAPRQRAQRPAATGSLARRLGAFLGRSPGERAAFEWTWGLMARSRSFKQRAYPGVAVVLVVGFALLFAPGDGFEDLGKTFGALGDSDRHLFLLYFAVVAFPNALAELRFTDRPQAAWIYQAIPLARPGELLLGSLKAMACRFVAPAFALIAAVVLAIWGLRVIVDVLLAATVAVAALASFALITAPAFPQSLPLEVMRRIGRQLHLIGFMMVGALVGVGHWLLKLVPGGVPLALPVALAIAWWAGRRFARTPWSAIVSDSA